MKIRTYQPGDEAIQAAIYNKAAGNLPKFKPATAEEVTRRCKAADFDPLTHLYAMDGNLVVGYATWQPNGRVGHPWCLPSHESAAEPLFAEALQALQSRGIRSAIAAYRNDWTPVFDFLRRHGFQQVREMVNFVLPLTDMPTRAAHLISMAPLRPEDVPEIFAMAPTVLRSKTAGELEKYLFHNPYFSAGSGFVFRSRKDRTIAGAGLLILNKDYADPQNLDAGMPCFRLGAFGTEGMMTKRVNGMFSFVTRDDGDALMNAVRMLEYAAEKTEDIDGETLAAQIPSDAPHLLRFYRQQFQRQGSFPVYEKILG